MQPLTCLSWSFEFYDRTGTGTSWGSRCVDGLTLFFSIHSFPIARCAPGAMYLFLSYAFLNHSLNFPTTVVKEAEQA